MYSSFRYESCLVSWSLDWLLWLRRNRRLSLIKIFQDFHHWILLCLMCLRQRIRHRFGLCSMVTCLNLAGDDRQLLSDVITVLFSDFFYNFTALNIFLRWLSIFVLFHDVWPETELYFFTSDISSCLRYPRRHKRIYFYWIWVLWRTIIFCLIRYFKTVSWATCCPVTSIWQRSLVVVLCQSFRE